MQGIAPDPDREGEAIAWHVAQLIKDKSPDIKRIQFNEITPRAVKEALAHPRDLNEDLFDAQQARRVLDRLVGYKISPLLWKTVKRGISAGRVQSVTLRLIVDREKEREAFVQEEYWVFSAILEENPNFTVQLQKIDGKKVEIHSQAEANSLLARIADKNHTVSDIEVKERLRRPQPPFITSTLQQAANQKFSYTSKRTMSIAQKLYEGVEIQDRGVTALITYMRTDSTRLSDEAKSQAKKIISELFGESYLPQKPNVYKIKGSAQDAHEAIRPVDASLTPEMLKSSLSTEAYNLYNLIWSRFLASQMAAANIEDTIILTSCEGTLWRAHGERVLFPGFLKIMSKFDSEKDSTILLPALTQGQSLSVLKTIPEQKFTQPPARYSESAIIKEMESNGIGRPSTYAATISTLIDRSYITLQDKHLIPTDLGRVVCEQLVEHFPTLMDVRFTAQMEENLDTIARGGENWVKLMHHFADSFYPVLDAAMQNMKSVKKGLDANINCPKCGAPLLVKFGKAGPFLACSTYPSCQFTSDFKRDEHGKIQITEREKPQYEKVGDCPKCGRAIVVKKAHTGSRFIACTGYPDCDYSRAFSTGVTCPQCGKGELVERSSKRGKLFYSCSTYPQCDFALWNMPVNESCPKCGSPYLIEKKSRSGVRIQCPQKDCGYIKEEDD